MGYRSDTIALSRDMGPLSWQELKVPCVGKAPGDEAAVMAALIKHVLGQNTTEEMVSVPRRVWGSLKLNHYTKTFSRTYPFNPDTLRTPPPDLI